MAVLLPQQPHAVNDTESPSLKKGFQIYCALLSLIMGSLGSNGNYPNFLHEIHGLHMSRTRFASHLDSSMFMRNEITGILVHQEKPSFRATENKRNHPNPSTKQMVLLKDLLYSTRNLGKWWKIWRVLLMGWNHKRLLSIRLGERVATGVSAWTVVIVMKVFVTLRGESEKLPTDIS